MEWKRDYPDRESDKDSQGFTKGEWKVISAEFTQKGVAFEVVMPKQEICIANAHLISAAPELYGACLSALGVMATLDQNKGWVKEILGIIKLALSKANRGN